MTYGQYERYPGGALGISEQLPQEIIEQNTYRQYAWVTSALRTFYAWLFKQIKIEDLGVDGNFFKMAGDMAFMFPMLEMAGHRSQFISEVLYVYNTNTPINDYKVDVELQQSLNALIRGKQKYAVLAQAPNTSTTHAGDCA
jgi:hypothetical protein